MNAQESTVRPMISRDGSGFGLALGNGRLAQVIDSGLRVLDVQTGQLLWEGRGQPIIACGSLADGSILAIERSDSETHAIHLRPAAEPVRYPMRHLVFAGRRELLAVPAAAQQFYLLDPERGHAELYDLTLVAGFLRLRKRLSLPASPFNDVVVLGDGALVQSDGSELQRIGPVPASGEPPRHSIAWSLASAHILTSGPSTDSLWAATDHGDMSLVQVPVEGTATIVRSFSIPGPVYQLAAAPGAVAVLQLEQAAGSDVVKWTLLLADEQGKQRFAVPLPAEPGAVPLATPPRNRCLRVSSTHVVIGGPDAVTVWEVSSGRLLYQSPASVSGQK